MRGPNCVLAIEDSEADHLILARVISKVWPGTRIVRAWDGAEGLALLQAMDEAEVNPNGPTLVFLDLNLPRVTGHELLERFYGPDRDVPAVIILTSSKAEADRWASSRHAAVVGYLVKPVSRAAIEELQPLAEGRPLAGEHPLAGKPARGSQDGSA